MKTYDWGRGSSVALIVFNRPDTTRRVFAEVARAKPKRLFVIADGARPSKEGEAQRCAEVRSIVQSIDWPCELTTEFAAENLGCRRRLSSGLTWLFGQTEEAIILEDDCIPHPSFFRYADELLERYRDDERIAQVCGSNFQAGRLAGADSYYFSRYPHIWGWASWRRAWRHYDVAMSGWAAERDGDWLERELGNRREAAYWKSRFDLVHSGGLDTWDYQWTYACWKQRMISILPRSNLISNVGFGADATHTKRKGSAIADLPTDGLAFPLTHPASVSRNASEDDFTDRMFFSGSRTLRGVVRRALGWIKGSL